MHNIKDKRIQAIILKLDLKKGLRLHKLGLFEVNHFYNVALDCQLQIG
jgi:hypothetical protein